MEAISSSVIGVLKSPKLSAAFFISSGAFLFFPFEKFKMDAPSFTSEYESYIFIVFVVSFSILVIEAIPRAWRFITSPYRRIQGHLTASRIVSSLNVNERCVLWHIQRQGMETIHGSLESPILTSMRYKGALYLIKSTSSMFDYPHAVPDRILQIVRSEGTNIFHKELRESPRFEEEVMRMVAEATSRW